MLNKVIVKEKLNCELKCLSVGEAFDITLVYFFKLMLEFGVFVQQMTKQSKYILFLKCIMELSRFFSLYCHPCPCILLSIVYI